MLYFFSYKRKLTIDIVQDIRKINDIAVRAHSTGMYVHMNEEGKHDTCLYKICDFLFFMAVYDAYKLYEILCFYFHMYLCMYVCMYMYYVFMYHQCVP
jgi:hypothetical protein